MSWLIYACLILVPLVTFPASIDPFQIKTLLVTITGLSALSYWLTKEWRGLASIPAYFWWVGISYFYCGYKLGYPGEEIILMTAYLGIFLYAKDYLKTENIVNALMVGLVTTLAYNFIGNHYSLKMAGMSSSFVNVNIYSGYLVLLVPLVLAKALSGHKLDWIVFIFAAFIVIGTGCRSSMLGVAAALAAFYGFYHKRHGWILGVLVCASFWLSWWYFSNHQILDPIRTHFWNGTLDMIKSRPWTGYGIGSFRAIYPLFKWQTVEFEDSSDMHLLENAHNEPFQILAETGIIGLALLLWLIYKAFKKADKANIFNLAMIAGIFGCLIDNLYNISLRYSAVGMIFWLYLALLAQSGKEKEDENWRYNNPPVD